MATFKSEDFALSLLGELIAERGSGVALSEPIYMDVRGSRLPEVHSVSALLADSTWLQFSGVTAILQCILEGGVDINDRHARLSTNGDLYRKTLLHDGIERGTPEYVAWLCARGADLSIDVEVERAGVLSSVSSLNLLDLIPESLQDQMAVMLASIRMRAKVSSVIHGLREPAASQFSNSRNPR